MARRRVKDLEFELQARKGRDEARSPEVQRQRERAEAFRQEAAQARGALDAERAARDAADALAADSRVGEAFVADDVADAAAAAAAAREARLWNAHVALVEKRDEEAKQLAELVDERDAYEAANRALATRVARLDKEAAERDARRARDRGRARGGAAAPRVARTRCSSSASPAPPPPWAPPSSRAAEPSVRTPREAGMETGHVNHGGVEMPSGLGMIATVHPSPHPPGRTRRSLAAFRGGGARPARVARKFPPSPLRDWMRDHQARAARSRSISSKVVTSKDIVERGVGSRFVEPPPRFHRILSESSLLSRVARPPRESVLRSMRLANRRMINKAFSTGLS